MRPWTWCRRSLAPTPFARAPAPRRSRAARSPSTNNSRRPRLPGSRSARTYNPRRSVPSEAPMDNPRRIACVASAAALVLIPASMAAQAVDPALYGDMRWRHVGPFRGGRTVGAAGVPQQPNVFYIGVNNGGGLKNTCYGRYSAPQLGVLPNQPMGSGLVSPFYPNIY